MQTFSVKLDGFDVPEALCAAMSHLKGLCAPRELWLRLGYGLREHHHDELKGIEPDDEEVHPQNVGCNIVNRIGLLDEERAIKEFSNARCIIFLTKDGERAMFSLVGETLLLSCIFPKDNPGLAVKILSSLYENNVVDAIPFLALAAGKLAEEHMENLRKKSG